jgi:hypothetical protein
MLAATRTEPPPAWRRTAAALTLAVATRSPTQRKRCTNGTWRGAAEATRMRVCGSNTQGSNARIWSTW